ncbi:MAG: hypothetical protein U0T02_10685 [Solirubrobacteraceae bacterium]
MSEAGRRFGFVQFEFPWALGPADGRYVLREAGPGDAQAKDAGARGAAAEHVVVLATLGAPERRRFSGRRPAPAQPEPPAEPVPTSRATVIRAEPLAGEGAARAWIRVDPEARAGEALVVLGRVIGAHRVAAADPHVREPGRGQALAARVGHGTGEQVAEGRWIVALTLPAPRGRRARRTSALRPQERLAALLAGRERALACEEMVLRARLDLDTGRDREAALQLAAALEAALAELPGEGELAPRRAELSERRKAVAAAAAAARAGELSPERREAVTAALGRLEAALRARSAGRR